MTSLSLEKILYKQKQRKQAKLNVFCLEKDNLNNILLKFTYTA